MKKQLLAILLCFAAMPFLNTKTTAQTVLIHYWSFNSFDAAGTKYYFSASSYADIPADFTGITSPVATFYYQPTAGTSTSYGGYYDSYPTVSNLDYDTVNLRLGDTAGLCFRARNPNDSSQILLYMPTTGYKNLVLTYGCEKTISTATSGSPTSAWPGSSTRPV